MSDAQKKRGRKPLPRDEHGQVIRDAVPAAKPLPKVSVLDRRLAHPFGAPSPSITLKTPGDWEIRIFNKDVRTGRIHDAVNKLGWVFVEADELDGQPDEYGFRVLDGRLVRGEHGAEVIMKMPRSSYLQIQQRKAEENLKALGSKKTREDVAQRTAQQFGAQAGDTVFQHVKVEDSREQMELEDEAPVAAS